MSTELTNPTAVDVSDSSKITKSLKSDINIMFKHAVSRGIELPTNLSLDENADSAALIGNYNALRKTIQPASIESIKYIQSQMLKVGTDSKWYQIPIFTKCVIVAFFALVLLICISLSPTVNETNQGQGLLDSSGMTLLFNLMFICAASLLGVMFYLLKTFGKKIHQYSLVAADSIELNAAILIGVISGFLISELFAFTLSNLSTDYIEVHKMTLALLGGFSSDAIFSILQGVVTKIKGLIGT